MTSNRRIVIALVTLSLVTLEVQARDERGFRMGLTSWPYAPTQAAVDDTVAFAHANGDIVAEQIHNGVPCRTLIDGRTLPHNFMEEVRARAARWRFVPPLFLSISPLNSNRGDIANAVATGARPNLGTRPFMDARVRSAYVEYCETIIQLFNPITVAYSIETNELLVKNKNQANDYAAFIGHIRRELKRAFPKLRFAQTVSIHGVLDRAHGGLEAQRPALRALLVGDDFTGISYYPFMALHMDEDGFRSALDSMWTLSRGPFAVSETGEIAEPLHVAALNFTIPGSKELQRRYVATLLMEAQKRRYQFVIYWAHRDYDELLKTFPEALRALGATWLRTGLLTSDDRARLALKPWKGWKALPFKQ